MAKDYYEILGVSKDATPEEIKKAYRTLSKELHPDKHPSTSLPTGQAGSGQTKAEAEQRFKEVNEAYETLTNPEKRRMYDQFGKAPPGGGGFGGFDFSRVRPEDFGGFSDLFETFFGGRAGGAKREEERGRDLEMRVRITFAESVTGARRSLSVRRLQVCDLCEGKGTAKGAKMITCADCGGTGQLTRTAQSFFGVIRQSVLCGRCGGSGKVPEKMCPTCDGEGRILREQPVTAEIPAGIADGQTVRLRKEGEAGRRGAASGDLYVRIDVEDDARFERDGDDIRSSVTISVLDAILGADVALETVHGPTKLRIPPGTQPHHVFRIKGKGMPVLHSRSHGDHYAAVVVRVPEKLSREERRLLEEWKNMSREQ